MITASCPVQHCLTESLSIYNLSPTWQSLHIQFKSYLCSWNVITQLSPKVPVPLSKIARISYVPAILFVLPYPMLQRKNYTWCCKQELLLLVFHQCSTGGYCATENVLLLKNAFNKHRECHKNKKLYRCYSCWAKAGAINILRYLNIT